MLDCPIVTGRLALEAGEGTRRLWPTDSCSPAGPPYSPVYGLWLGVSGPEGRMGLESPERPGVTRDPSSSAIFELSALHHVEGARPEMTETAALLPGTSLGHTEGGHGEGCSLEALARSAAPNGQCTPLPELEGAGSGGLGEAELLRAFPARPLVLLPPPLVAQIALRGPGRLLCPPDPEEPTCW